jgi:DNA-binding phage protein
LRVALSGGGTPRRQQAGIDRAGELHAQYCAIQRREKHPASGRQGREAHELIGMALTRDFKKTVVASVERDPALTKALLDEAATRLPADDPQTARLILRDLVNATLGFEQLAQRTDLPSKNLHRMRSPKGNPSMDDLAAIFGAVGSLKADLNVRTVQAA